MGYIVPSIVLIVEVLSVWRTVVVGEVVDNVEGLCVVDTVEMTVAVKEEEFGL